MKIIAGLATTILVLNMAATGAYCAEGKGVLHVSATVLPAVKYEILHQADSYTVTRADIDKGYTDIRDALVFSVRTNSDNGYLMTVAFNNALIRGLRLLDEKTSYIISGGYQEVHLPHDGINSKTKELGLRIYLSEDIKPGIYQLPVAVMVSAM